MTTFAIFKETSVPAPGSLTPHSIYLVAPPGSPDHFEMYVTGASVSTLRRNFNEADVQALINASLSGISALQVVADIAARNALSPTANTQVLVLDATADSTVANGAATYVWQQSTTTWHKISEAESLDVTLSWANIVGAPTSTPAQIDAAVANGHTHANKTQLDNIGEAAGEMTYNGVQVKTTWSNTAW